ncbi:MAG: orotidine-5'-phosphate decarboxylase, partial [Planctomycetota bacterium]
LLRPNPSASIEQIVQSVETFCLAIIDAVADLVPAVKPQAAFFEELGPPGMVALHKTVRYANQRGLLVIMDAKRGDIGTTAAAYANAYLGSGAPGSSAYSPWGADALTINPYLGADTLEPFTQRCATSGSGLFVLVKTSNPGSSFFQDQRLEDGRTVSEKIADYVESLSYSTRGDLGYGDIGAVVGATYPKELQAMRQRMPSAWILIPGYGAQGGSAQDVKLGLDSRGLGAIVNSSRGIIFAYEQPKYQATQWTTSVRNATLDMIEALS